MKFIFKKFWMETNFDLEIIIAFNWRNDTMEIIIIEKWFRNQCFVMYKTFLYSINNELNVKECRSEEFEISFLSNVRYQCKKTTWWKTVFFFCFGGNLSKGDGTCDWFCPFLVIFGPLWRISGQTAVQKTASAIPLAIISYNLQIKTRKMQTHLDTCNMLFWCIFEQIQSPRILYDWSIL